MATGISSSCVRRSPIRLLPTPVLTEVNLHSATIACKGRPDARASLEESFVAQAPDTHVLGEFVLYCVQLACPSRIAGLDLGDIVG
jgi:hypothetical protein